MDANGLRFWMLAERHHWDTGAGAEYDRGARRLRLRSGRDRALPSEVNGTGAEAEARDALLRVPQARDLYGTRARWDGELRAVVASGAVPGAVRLLELPDGSAPDDLAVGYDGVLYLAVGGRVRLHDLRGRWEDEEVAAPGFTAWRLAPDPAGGMWVLDREAQRLGHLHGLPFPDRPYAPYSACTARPCEENPHPPTLQPLPAALWPEREAVAIATAPGGRLALLCWRAGGEAELRVQRPGAGVDLVITLRGIRFPYTLAWISESAVAVRVTRLAREALIYEIGDALSDAGERADGGPAGFDPSGDIYPLRSAVVGPFAHTLELPPHYPTREVRAPEEGEEEANGAGRLSDATAPLYRLSSPAYSPAGEASGRRPFDSGSAGTVWHRLYLEALLPPGCGVRVRLAASDEARRPEHPADWHEHRFGDLAPLAAEERPVPRGAWVSVPSEIPFSQGVLDCPTAPARSGLFTSLVQRSNRPVRALRGRYLWVRVELTGDRRSTPEVAALRAYGSRFSYVERYLPELYHEQLFGAEREQLVPPRARPATTAADFLERFLGNVEGVLTLIEDRIASAHLLTDPRTVPEASLEWLGSWIGLAFDPVHPAASRRELLRAAAHLFRLRGTLAGLRDALGIATGGRLEEGRIVGGAVNGGEIVILENWRLRRTFATILGADLADEEDPLLGGIAVSGNSYVGDTLILGEECRKEFLALFAADLPTDAAEREAIEEFFERQAHRVTVLVHQEVEPQDLGLIRRIVELEKPAHVAAFVASAAYPFLVGMASLVGVDSYLRAPVPPRPVDLDRSTLGTGDFLLGPPSLDPRLTSSRAAVRIGGAVRPTAVLRAPARVPIAESFTLDGSRSRAAPGRELAEYSWTRLR